ncbi:MBL fold metallo-hydrolase [Kitasatospora sp. NPDC049258]|uniref:MBL fold metallo-hydrolase n=1 Tax=Kitasatospora sp. NPDC049258 TaxID=3155394 RepID=UPI00343E4A26
MGHWYEQRESAGGVVRITEPKVRALLSANVWWLRGADRDLVVDAGLGVVPLRAALPQLFARDPLLVLTHAHLDHVGGAPEFRSRAAHAAAAELLGRGVPASLYGAELSRQLGIPADGAPLPELLLKALPYPDYDPATYRIGPITLTQHLHDGDRIDLGDRSLTVLHLPGHTPGCLALLDEHTGELYSGDVIYDGDLIDDLPESDIPTYRRSLQLLADLDIALIHPGHGPSFPATRLRELTAAYLRATD